MTTNQQSTMVGQQLVTAAHRFAELLATADGAAVAKPTAWTVAQTAAHVLAELSDHVELAETGAKPDLGDGPAWVRGRRANAEQLRRYAERDVRVLAGEIVPAAERAAAVLGSLEGEAWSSNGLLWPGARTVQVLLGELLVHGLDVARASGRPWEIDRADAYTVMDAALADLPSYLKLGKPGRRLSFELRLRGGPAYRIDVAGDDATVGPAGGRVDCTISADPVAFLKVGYGRANPIAAALTGKVVASGRKPWLALSFGSLLAAP